MQQATSTETQVIREPYYEIYNTYPESVLIDAPVNIDPAKETRTYQAPDKKFTIQIPYNPDWGIGRFRLELFEQIDSPLGKAVLTFGPLRIIPFEGCCWIGREFYLSAQPKRTIEQIKTSESEQSDIEVVRIGSRQVAKLTYKCPDQEGLAGYPEDENCFFGLNTRYEIPLEETNLLITGSTFAQNPDLAIEEMIKSIKEHR